MRTGTCSSKASVPITAILTSWDGGLALARKGT
jgi:hypothetical protein